MMHDSQAVMVMAEDAAEEKRCVKEAGKIHCPAPVKLLKDETEAKSQPEGTSFNQTQRKHHSESVHPQNKCGTEERKCCDRRRRWRASKQESFDLPDEFKCATEDNVFADADRSQRDHKGRFLYQRSWSMPSMPLLPDVVPEKGNGSGNVSPDVVSYSDKETWDNDNASCIVSQPSKSAAEILEDKEKKQSFEGSVYCGPTSSQRRKKSVTFETAVNIVRIMSSKGIQARSHFRSSGYGSQSDNSQASQVSNQSTEQGSVMSDDVLMEKSFEADETQFDGSIDSKEDEADRTQSEAHPNAENPQKDDPLECSSEKPGSCTVLPQTPTDLIDEVEMWRRQMSPKFHCGSDSADLPNLSIFDSDSLLYSIGGMLSDQFRCGADRATENMPQEQCDPLLSGKTADDLGTGSKSRESITELSGSGNKTSPVTKEECQRELYKRLFEDKMLKFDNTKETIFDLFEWVKKNIGEALTPSPKSPFFSREGSPQCENIKVPQAVTDALQEMGLSGCKDTIFALLSNSVDQRLVPNEVGKSATSSQPANSGHDVPLPFTQYIQQTPLQHSQNLKEGQHGPLSQKHNPAQHVVPASQHCHTHFPQACHPSAMYQHERGMPPSTAVARDERVRPPPCTYQQDLPAIVDEIMPSSICIPSDELSTSVGASHLEQLINVSHCSYIRCVEPCCVQGKKSLHDLKEALKIGPASFNMENLHTLKLLVEHYNSCELPNCPVLWCRYMTYRSPIRCEKTSQDLVTSLSGPLLVLLPPYGKDFEFVKLDSSLPGDALPQEWEDWLMIYPLSESYTVAKVRPLINLWPRREWVVKMTHLHEEGNQLEVYKKLRDLQHLHIIHHVWIAVSYSSEFLVVCTDFLPGLSLRDRLDQTVLLGLRQTCFYLLQILSATQYLHDLDIVFLNWTCSNLLLDQSHGTVKLSNFVTSVDLSSHSADIGTVKLTLPADVVPTELLIQGGELTHNSDSWGLACIVHEMLTGFRPWSHLRHCSKETTWNQILKQVPPQVTADLPKCVQFMIHDCLQRSPDSRLSVAEIQKQCQTQWL